VACTKNARRGRNFVRCTVRTSQRFGYATDIGNLSCIILSKAFSNQSINQPVKSNICKAPLKQKFSGAPPCAKS